MTTPFPVVAVSGTAFERGVQHGQALRERIFKTFQLYESKVFGLNQIDNATLEQAATRLADNTGAFQCELVEEMDGIAQGAGLEPWKIYALNARTEILNSAAPECTSAWFQEAGILGQTWDWIRDLEDLFAVLDIHYPTGHRILTLTEPGILAKVGINSAGLGVCLNILLSEHANDGVPVHPTIRAVLETRSVSEASDLLDRIGAGKASHLLIADASGDGFGIEFAGAATERLQATDGVLLHTNHCIGTATTSTMLPSSAERLEQAQQWMQKVSSKDTAAMEQMLLDDRYGPLSIQSCYRHEAMLNNLEVGTCATIIMDLAERKMRVRKGPGATPDFHLLEIEHG